MTRCDQCGFDWDTPAEVLPSEIANIGSRYRAVVLNPAGEPPPGDRLLARPAEGVWSAIEYLGHMRDVAPFYRDRIERVLTEHRPEMPVGMRFAELAELRSYRDEDPGEMLDALDRVTTEVGTRLRGLADHEWSRVGIGSEGGERSVLVLARRLAHEAHHHLDDIERGFGDSIQAKQAH